MNNDIVFNFFLDSKDVAIAKLSEYFCVPIPSIEKALYYGCSTYTFINELKIDLCDADSSCVRLIGRHVTTSNEDALDSFKNNGLLDLRRALQEDTPLYRFLKNNGIVIDVDNKLFKFSKYSILIEGKKTSEHICFKGRDTVCSQYFGCDALQKLYILDAKLYDLGATLEFFVAGTMEEMLEYSTVSRCPEILDTIDQLISSIQNPYSRCMYPLCCKWIAEHSKCYVIEFMSVLSNMETFNPVNYLNAYNEIKECFNWSNVTYNDYYECRVPQRVFDNKYLIDRIIDVYVYGNHEQYGSLQPGMFIQPEIIKIYGVENEELVII